MAQSCSHSLTGALKLSQDIATLINSRQGSDIQFKVGGGNTVFKDDGTVYNESATTTIHAHSAILRCRSRYFAIMLDEEKQWKESTKGIIYKPNVSYGTFLDVLYYIYTGNVRAKSSENIIELIAAAEEMSLDELSIECQTEVIRAVKFSLSDMDDGDHGNESGETFEGPTERRLPIDLAVRTLIIPALKLAHTHTLSNFLQELLTIILPRMSMIIASPNSNAAFIDGVSSQTLAQILSSDSLGLKEHKVWDLALKWACRQENLLKTAVEAHLKMRSNADNDEENDEAGSSSVEESNDDDGTKEHVIGISDPPLVSDTQLKHLKAILVPLLPAIRFTLLEPDDFTRMVDILNYFLSPRQILELQQFFSSVNRNGLPSDVPRIESIETVGETTTSKIIVESTTWNLLRKSIFEAGGIVECFSPEHLKFELIFRASDHGFLANTFHQRCDNKGPTLALVRSSDGHLFGGVNFFHWDSSSGWVSSPLNFLFALPDGNHRKDLAIFKVKDSNAIEFSAYNYHNSGPRFGNDLCIMNSSNTNQTSFSNLPTYYNGNGASCTSLAGTQTFMVSDYEVFAISKKRWPYVRYNMH